MNNVMHFLKAYILCFLSIHTNYVKCALFLVCDIEKNICTHDTITQAQTIK